MKAWFVYANNDYEWGDFVHGETVSQAKSMFWRSWGIETEWIDLRVRRIPSLDDTPLTSETICKYLDDIDFMYEGEQITRWHPICNCKTCKPDSA